MDGAGLKPRIAIVTGVTGALAWLTGSLAWLSADRLIRDGDEEGHVGAAELLVSILRDDGLLTFLATALAGDLGEYPPLYPAVVAVWWSLFDGQPGALVVRAVNLLWPVIAAAACASIARRLARPALPVAVLVLMIPGACGLSRHFMPEGMLIAAVSLAALAALWAADQPSWRRAAVLGVALGAGMLVKQTFVLYALPMALWALWRLRVHATAAIAVPALLAGPWYVTHLGDQIRYGTQSLETLDPGWLSSVSYYPIVGVLTELGPVLAGATLLGLWSADRRSRWLIGLWVGLALLLLIGVPRKYPRLLVPLLPLLMIWAGGIATTRLRTGALLGLAGGWVTLASLVLLPEVPLPGEVDEGCLQRWLRPPVVDDFGMAEVADAVRQRGAATVVVLAAPEIPCTVQTTHGWQHHLAPYLRRDGFDVEVLTEPTPGAVVIDWTQGDRMVPALGRHFEIR